MLLSFNVTCMRNAMCYAAIALLLSCVNEGLDKSSLSDLYPVESCVMSVEVDDPEFKDMTRSSFTDEQLDKMTSLNVFIYHEGRLVKECCRYFTDMSALTLTLPCSVDGFNIYMVGNVREIEPPVNEVDMVKVRLLVEDYDDFREKGVPVAACFTGYEKGDLAHFKLKRMTGQYNISMKSSATDAQYLIKDVRLMNCARDIYPFSEDIKAYDMVRTGDTLTLEDLDRLNAGEAVPLYFVENLQGVLLPDNKDKKKKIPSHLELVESGIADRCTYIEITADILTPSARYSNAKYRFYLGQDQVSDFNIKRNTLYNVTLDFTQNMVNEEEWRIEVDEPEVVEVSVDKDTVMIMEGIDDVVYVQGFGHDGNLMDFDISASGGSSDNSDISVKKFETVFHGRPAVAFKFGWMSYITRIPYRFIQPTPRLGNHKFLISSKETYNGKPVYSKEIEVLIYEEIFPVLMKLEMKPGNNNYSIALRSHNPMGLALAVSCTYKCKDGTSGQVPEVVRCNAHVETSGGWCLQRNAVSETTTYFGDLPSSVTPATLSQIHFKVRCMGSIDGVDLAYPKPDMNTDVYTGNPSKWGPNADMYPAAFKNMPEDTDYRIWCGYGHSSGSVSEADYYYAEKYSTNVTKTASGPWKHIVVDVDNRASTTYFAVGIDTFIPVNSVEDHWDYRGAPFCFFNGVQAHSSSTISIPGSVGNWNNKNTRKVEYKLYGSGRDLFSANKDGTLIDNMHTVVYSVQTWTNFFGVIQTAQKNKKYSGQLYMTINDSQNWPGGDFSQYGFFDGDF